MKNITKSTGAGALAMASLAATLSFAALDSSPAQAAGRDGKCDSGEFCYNYNSDLKGSWSDFTTSLGDYGASQPSCWEFKGSGSGKGKCVKNNAGGYWNRTSKNVVVYYNSNYGGATATLKAGSKGKLPGAVYNNNASHKIGGTSGGGGGGSVTGTQAASRAKSWVAAGVGYSQTSTYQGYRKDCSGYVSMAWGLSKPGLTTYTMPKVGSYIGKGSLKRGDALLAPGHVTMFDKWANSAKTEYWAYEESPSKGAVYRKIPYPYWSGYGNFKPFRYKGLK
ncbi:peptidase inhibitor family I36 protein [Dermacoccaceae bacterium W4C1]